VKASNSREKVELWSEPDLGDVGLMRATYVTQTFPRHTHETFGVGVIESGALGFYYRGENVVASSGEISLVNPDEAHTGHAAAASGWTYRMFHLSPDLLRSAASQVADRPWEIPFFQTGVIRDPDLAAFIHALHSGLEQGEEMSTLEKESRFLWMLTRLITRHSDAPPAMPVAGAPGAERARIKRAREYIQACHQENLSVDQLAAVANLSPFHFIRVFQKEVGIPPHAYLNQTRIRRARDLLAQGMDIASVAQETGFVDQSHLTRHFKRILGITPGNFRNSVQDRR
jgi:AraC-like DNA-binding protein